MNKNCEFCGKEIVNQKVKGRPPKYCSDKCRYNADYYRNQETKQKRARDYKLKNFERDKIKNRLISRDWYQKNKERQNKNVLNYYYKNKEKCDERKKTDKHKKQIFAILPNICANCGKNEIEEIHHIEYGHYPKYEIGIGREGNREIREEYYKKYLLLFCSCQCHKEYERKLRHQNI